MKLSELDGAFVRLTDYGYLTVERIEEAQGVMFVCPGCVAKLGTTVGAHSILCWSRSRGVPDGVSPGPGRWTLVGTGIGDLSLEGDPVGSASSVLLSCWHGHIKNGEATFC